MERGPGGGLKGKEPDGVRGQTASGAWAGTAHDKAQSKDSGDINALTVLPGAVCGWQRGGAARAKVLMPLNDD